MTEKAFIIAGEPSGDNLAASLMRSQKERYEWHGMGGPAMMKEGLSPLADYSALHVLGIFQALSRYQSLKSLLNKLVDDACTLRPSVIFTIDAKAFSVRFAKAMRQKMAEQGWHAPIIHMVAPTIWAYGEGRKDAFEEHFDGMLCLFPMEQGLFDETAVKIGYVGHPSAYQEPISRQIDTKKRRLLLLPGSRRREVETLLPLFLKTAQILSQEKPLSTSIVTTTAMEPLVSRFVGDNDVQIYESEGQLQKQMATHHLCLAASGTVTLESALSALPGIVAYKLNPILGLIMRWRFKQKDPILANIILQNETYPFCFQSQVNATHMANLLGAQFANFDAVNSQMAQHAASLRQSLRPYECDFETAIATAIFDMKLT